MFIRLATKAALVFSVVRANVQDCAANCNSAGNSGNPYGDLTKLMNGGSNCNGTQQPPMGGNNGGMICLPTVPQFYPYPPPQPNNYTNPPPGTNQPPKGNEKPKEECELTSTIECKPKKNGDNNDTTSNLKNNDENNKQQCNCDDPNNQKSQGEDNNNCDCGNNNNQPPQPPVQPPQPPQVQPPQPPQVQPPQPVNCDCSNYQGNQNNPPTGGQQPQQCDCSNYQPQPQNYPPQNQTYQQPPQITQPPLYVTQPLQAQNCDCSNYGGNQYNPPTGGQQTQPCDCSNFQPQNQTYQQPYGGNYSASPMPCAYGNPYDQNQNLFNDCYKNPPAPIRTANIGKVELPLADNVTFAPNSCVQNQGGSC